MSEIHSKGINKLVKIYIKEIKHNVKKNLIK